MKPLILLTFLICTAGVTQAQFILAPNLIAPENDAEELSTTVVFVWESVLSADTYEIQLATEESFDVIVFDDLTTDTSIQVDDLDYETTYYWHVRASGTFGTSDWSETRRFTTEDDPVDPSPLTPPDLLAPEDEATDQSTDLKLEWQHLVGADYYQMQLATEEDFDSPVIERDEITSTSTDVEDLNFNTTYYWRVKAFNDNGESAWSEIWSFTTEQEPVEPPDAPVLASPEDGATDRSTAPTLEWEPAARAESYDFQVAEDEGFEEMAAQQSGLTETSATLEDLDYETTYHWRVRGENESGPGDWSAVWTFTTEQEPVEPPDAPVLASPEDGATGISTSPIMVWIWDSGARAESYDLQLAVDSNFEDLVVDLEGLSATKATLEDLAYATTYYWRVRGANKFGPGDWSSARSFSTIEEQQVLVPNAPVLKSPENGAGDQPTTVTFEWEEVLIADFYHLQVAVDADFQDPVADQNGLTETSATLEDLDYETTYHWRVRGENESGPGDWSDAWSFTTEEEPVVQISPPEGVSPEQGEEGLPVDTVRIEWTQVEGADTYDFQLAKDSDFEDKTVDLIDGTSQYYHARELEYGTTYWWRVRSKNESHTTDWAVSYFSTEYGSISYNLTSPSNGEIWRANEVRNIEWRTEGNASSGVDGASGYVNISYSTDDGQTWSLISEEERGDTGSYEWTIPDISTLNARIRIIDTGNNEKQSVSDPFIIYPATVNVSAGYSFNDSKSSSDYRLISLPAQTNISVEQIFDGEHIEHWKVYWDNGGESDYLVAYDESENFHFKPGKAFWAISRNSIDIEDSFEAVPLSEDTTFAIPLHQGWNIISNPFHIPIEWYKVMKRNELEEPIWGFDGTYQQSDELKPYQGYYFFNENELDELQIPYYEDSIVNQNDQVSEVNYNKFDNDNAGVDYSNTGTDKKRVSPSVSGKDKDNKLSLSIHTEDGRKSRVWIGFDPSRAKEIGWYGYKAPPGDFLDYYLTIIEDSYNDDDSRFNHYETLIRPGIGHLQSYTLQLKARRNETVRFKTGDLQHIDDSEIYLVSSRTGKFYNLRDDQPVRLTPADDRTYWTLLIGLPDAIEDAKDQYLPEEFNLYQNYPNPFNAQTVIEFSIPESDNDQHVMLEVFDIQGRRVATLIDEHKPAGFYSRQWDASGLASGVYIYRLKVGLREKNSTMTLIK